MKEGGMSESVEQRLKRVHDALRAADPQGKVALLAVSKTFGPEAVLLAARLGQTAFGENYAQEGCAKVDWFREHHPEVTLQWHFIGPLQANKTRMVAERFDWVQSIDRVRIAQRLSDQRPSDLPALNVLVEVNVDGQETKSGVHPDEVRALCEAVAAMPGLKLRGLMAIPAPVETSEGRKAPLRAMRALFDELKDDFGLDTLSMGMSADMIEAVECGTTMVRVGSAIFGTRAYPHRG
jgi:pyridoxal phosphate enzyme (YggS family)